MKIDYEENPASFVLMLAAEDKADAAFLTRIAMNRNQRDNMFVSVEEDGSFKGYIFFPRAADGDDFNSNIRSNYTEDKI